MTLKKTEKLVIPGEKLGVIEEFSPGRSTYVNEGVIRSKAVGLALYDRASRKINVLQKSRSPLVPVEGHTVLGEVQQVQDKVATIKLLKINNTELKKPFPAILHVSFVSKFFVKSLRDALKPGDIILAEIIGDKNIPYQLTTASRDLGVVQAYCSNCGDSLVLNKKQLSCRKCGIIVRREISDKYGQEV